MPLVRSRPPGLALVERLGDPLGLWRLVFVENDKISMVFSVAFRRKTDGTSRYIK